MSNARLSPRQPADPVPRSGMRAAVLGSPVAHSLSPVLHRAAYAALGLTWSYTAMECDERRLPALLDSLDGSWAGLSLTMPLKRAVLPLVDEVTPLALDVGGANTVILRDGRRYGHNTDVHGILAALREEGLGGDGRPDAVILGGGATACSALAALKELGQTDIPVVVRESSRGGQVCAAATRLGVAVRYHAFDELGDALDGARLVLSTLPAGAADPYAGAIARSGADVFDVVYTDWPTRLARAARFGGARAVGGHAMLLHQAVRQVELMTGRSDVPVEEMRRAVRTEIGLRAA
ncbi:shikimate dehydrogenase [Streptomyces sp. V4I23]|uniref:shikimate dehydrogenase n=1 Tax=Streptomyces sp. V4I23 TaxID=3042282 RepID=UPI002788B332|nr:shikimate dehydrogenase [Streptomyces sp. V4I23]MDQ1009269.1 shikimate dehydrogenase [Streptomyces sp. V4I23]